MGQQLAAKQKGSFHAWSQIQRNSINSQKAVNGLKERVVLRIARAKMCADGEEWRRSEQMSRTEKAEELAFLVAFTLKKLKKY
uniref:Uncharacterized protein n=1 Tax=Oryza nivara TaxID=4536 RepID=A0A0E0FYW5_ORYNI